MNALLMIERNQLGKLKKKEDGEKIKMARKEVQSKRWKIMMVERLTWVRLSTVRSQKVDVVLLSLH